MISSMFSKATSGEGVYHSINTSPVMVSITRKYMESQPSRKVGYSGITLL